MRISDWSSDVCSSDLAGLADDAAVAAAHDAAGDDHLEVRLSAQDIGNIEVICDDPEALMVHQGVRHLLGGGADVDERSEEPTSELQSLMRISYAVFCLKKKKTHA